MVDHLDKCIVQQRQEYDGKKLKSTTKDGNRPGHLSRSPCDALLSTRPRTFLAAPDIHDFLKQLHGITASLSSASPCLSLSDSNTT